MIDIVEFNTGIPKKTLGSYILYLFPMIFVFSFLRKIFIRMTMKNCKNVDFEPGFRFKCAFSENPCKIIHHFHKRGIKDFYF